MALAPWEFSIDVGGTFTDVLARATDGSCRRLKLLSSGVIKGQIGAGSKREWIVDLSRANDPEQFWRNWRCIVYADDGAPLGEWEVAAFDAADVRLELVGRLPPAAVGKLYELRAPLDSPVIAIRYLLGLTLADAVPPVILRLGTTRGTNALLTRRGASTALVTTRGFGDVLEIGYQARPHIFDLTIRKPPLLTAAIVEIDERMAHDGNVLVAPRESAVRTQLAALRRTGIEAVAICLLHADRHPAHERLVGRIARELGFAEVCMSHEAAPLPKIVARADTTVVDAYLNPVLRDYVARLAEALPGSHLRFLTSSGGLVAASEFRGKDSILSGPAGGVVGFSRAARATGFEAAIGFDMGGTSTDVARFDARCGDRFELEYETEKAGVRLVTPTIAIETVAAGGGSICRFDGIKLVVGPDSAGADPGPACYGRGGPLTVTDCNYFLGRLAAERFPFPLDHTATRSRLEQVVVVLANHYSLEELAAGFLRIANANMAAAIRLVTVAKGANPRECVLVAFGSAGPQHACAVAGELGMRKILIHPDAGILSAVGIRLAKVVRHRSFGIERPLTTQELFTITTRLDALESTARQEVIGEGVAATQIHTRRSLELRYQGVDCPLEIDWPDDGDFAAAFTNLHRHRYGYFHTHRAIEVAAARLEVTGNVAYDMERSYPATVREPGAGRTAAHYVAGRRIEVPHFDRAALVAGDRIVGPALISEPLSTTVVDAGWVADVWTAGELVLTASADAPAAEEASALASAAPDPVLLEVFNNQLVSIASQMGVRLRNTASSVNVKERLDFSCAIFTADGRLVANAPHVPVHLGAMEETVRQTLAANTDLAPGDVFVTNDPYAGGSHLPDVTTVTPVHNAASKLLFVVANRAHHAEIGGTTPGSMPPFSQTLADEGVLIRNRRLIAAGESRFDELRLLLSSGPYPSRSVDANLADLAAQVAANQQGAADLLALVARYTEPLVACYMDHVQQAARFKVCAALARLPVGIHKFVDHLETPTGTSVPIAVAFSIHPAGQLPAATIDFTGTSPVIAGNLNANRAIVTAAVIYVLRLLVAENIPLNHGVLQPIELVLPECMLNPLGGATCTAIAPQTLPAVAGGNVETSQRVVDALLGALGIAGASQGTMNNLLFGDDTFGYYETICGGSGATDVGPGASAIQVHMTNTRLTDPELLERRFPVRLRRFAIRRDSGGAGRQRGGDGVVRELEFLRPLTVSLITQRRGPHPPYGMAGGAAGSLGRNRLIHAAGDDQELPGIIQFGAAPGDVLIIETPGGGGFGEA